MSSAHAVPRRLMPTKTKRPAPEQQLRRLPIREHAMTPSTKRRRPLTVEIADRTDPSSHSPELAPLPTRRPEHETTRDTGHDPMPEKPPPPVAILPATRRDFGQDRDRFRSFDVYKNNQFEAGQSTVNTEHHDATPANSTARCSVTHINPNGRVADLITPTGADAYADPRLAYRAMTEPNSKPPRDGQK